MELYDCSHAEMCIKWNELAEHSIRTMEERQTLHLAVAAEFLKRKSKRIRPYFIPFGMSWSCNPTGNFGHYQSLCSCQTGTLNPYVDTLFQAFMTCMNRTLIISLLFPGALLIFADTETPCEKFRDLFYSADIRDLVNGKK